MKLFVGLGNPEAKYLKNRHNVGYIVIDALNEKLKSQYKRKPSLFSQKFLQSTIFDYSPFACLAKPKKYMNDSGVAAKKLFEAYKVDPHDFYIIHDDLDIALGEYKITYAKGPKVHNGLTSVEEELNNKDFGRIRVGIENRDPKKRIPGDKYVLEDFTEDEEKILKWTIQKLINDEFFETLRYA